MRLAAALLLALSLFRFQVARRPGAGEVVFFDVGQGDATLVRFADGRSVLVDAGGGEGENDRGRRTLRRELARLGVTAPTVAILSHSDRDHAYGFFGIVEAMRLEAFYLHREELVKPRPLVPALAGMLALRGTRLVPVDVPSRLDFGSGAVEIVPVASGEARNGTQLGATVTLGRCRFVLLGDMSEAAERRWLAGGGGRGGATVLKVSHHGSRTSSAPELLRTLRPRWAVVSSGADNRYGHPVPEVLDRLRAIGAEVLRTDFHGAVRFRVRADGALECESAEGPCGRVVCQ